MATINLTLIKGKQAKDGSNKLRIAICHKEESAYILTNIKVDNPNQFKNGQIVKRTDAVQCNIKLRNLLNEYQEKLDAIKNMQLLDCKQVRDILKNGSATIETCVSSIENIYDKYIDGLKEENRTRYAEMHTLNKKYLVEFFGFFLVENLTTHLILNYSKFLKKKNLSDTSVKIFMTHTRVIINHTIKAGVAKYETHPFSDYKIRASEAREIDISVESINRIKSYDGYVKHLKVARDLFMISFYLGGINLIDLLEIDFRDTDAISYIRTKSKNTKHGEKKTVVPIHAEAKALIKEWMNKRTGRLDFGYKFSYTNFSRYLSRCLAKLTTELDIKEKVVYYSARKTFAQFASELGIPDGVIDYCLGHSDRSKGIIRFYTKVKQKQAGMAIERVIDYVNNPTLYKEYMEMRADIMLMKMY